MFFGNIFFELLSILGSVVVVGIIIVAVAFVAFVVGAIIRGMLEGFKKTGGKK